MRQTDRDNREMKAEVRVTILDDALVDNKDETVYDGIA